MRVAKPTLSRTVLNARATLRRLLGWTAFATPVSAERDIAQSCVCIGISDRPFMVEDAPFNTRVGSHDQIIHKPPPCCRRDCFHSSHGDDECCCNRCLRRRSDACRLEWTCRSAFDHCDRSIDRSGARADPQASRGSFGLVPSRLHARWWQLCSRQSAAAGEHGCASAASSAGTRDGDNDHDDGAASRVSSCSSTGGWRLAASAKAGC